MKTSRMLALTVFLSLVSLLPAIAQSISPVDARKHIGEGATVCGKVVNEWIATGSTGHPTFINLDVPYPNEVFRMVIWEEDRTEFGALPSVGAHVCVTGMIRMFRGVPQVVVRSSTQFGH